MRRRRTFDSAPLGDGGSNFFSQAIAGTAPSEGIAPANSTLGGAGGYIENAIPRSQFRVRYDLVGGVNHPDRAQYFWPQFGPNTVGALSYQEIHNYFEYAPKANLSVFFDAPVRFLHLPNVGPGTPPDNYGGFSDLQLGLKYAFVARPDLFRTFQFKTYVPTGDARAGLGTGHASFEPGLLLFRRISERGYVMAQFSDWIPIGSLNYQPNQPSGAFVGPPTFSGNVLTYGIGGFYNVVQRDHFRFAPVAETIGWTCLSGRTGVGPESANTTESAAGDTIVNIKVGARLGIGEYLTPGGASPLNDWLSLYAGYARSMTGDVWYKNMFRLELTYYF